MSLKEIIKKVDPEFRQEFEQFLITGNSTNSFDEYLEHDPNAAQAAEAAADYLERKPK